MNTIPGRRIIMTVFLVFLLLPIYWLVNMSFKTNAEIVSTMTLWPHQPTLENYKRIFTDESWYSGYINSLKYVIINTIISISVALPAAYAFSRYRFLGDKHLFFWLLSNRMAPAAVFALPFFNLYSAINLFDTPWAVALAHCIFNVPLAVWILEGFVSGVPREIDETAFLDGYSFPRFFIKILVPLIASGIGVETLNAGDFFFVHQREFLDRTEAFGGEQLSDHFVEIERLDEYLGAIFELGLTALGFFLFGQDVDVPPGKLRRKPHILSTSSDCQRQLLVRDHDLDALLVFVEHDLGDFRRRQRVHHECGDVRRPWNDVDLLALQFVYHRLHA